MTLAAARITGAPADGSVERVQGVEGGWGWCRGQGGYAKHGLQNVKLHESQLLA